MIATHILDIRTLGIRIVVALISLIKHDNKKYVVADETQQVDLIRVFMLKREKIAILSYSAISDVIEVNEEHAWSSTSSDVIATALSQHNWFLGNRAVSFAQKC